MGNHHILTLTDDNSQTQSVSLSNILWKLYITLGAIQVLRNADGGGGGGCPFFRYEGVRFNVISVTRGWVGVQIPGKKRYVTLEWPLPWNSPHDTRSLTGVPSDSDTVKCHTHSDTASGSDSESDTDSHWHSQRDTALQWQVTLTLSQVSDDLQI